MRVREIAAGVAADIRRYGHYQSRDGQRLITDELSPDELDGIVEIQPRGPLFGCCVLFSPSLTRAKRQTPSWHAGVFVEDELVAALSERLGFVPDGRSGPILNWNDSTPTDQVLAVLDDIAASS